jgi:hypothetical protein
VQPPLTWREGTTTRRAEEWCLIDWPVGVGVPSKFGFSTLPAAPNRTKLVRHTLLSGRIERHYQELKQGTALATTRAVAGEASTTMPPPPSLTSNPWSSNGRRLYPPPNAPRHAARRLPFRQPGERGEPPTRPERHVINTIATMRSLIESALTQRLPRCPC